MPVGVGGGKEGGGCHLNMRTWHAEGRRPSLGLCWPSLGLCWPILRPWWPMPMRTKCCNLQHSALWDGKNPCKYQSCSPRKWLKHSYLQSFVHITIFVFWKTCKYQRFFAFIKTKHRFKKCKKCCNLQGSGPVASKKLRKYQRFDWHGTSISMFCMPRFHMFHNCMFPPDGGSRHIVLYHGLQGAKMVRCRLFVAFRISTW